MRLGRAAAEQALNLLEGRRLYIADGHHRVAAAIRRWERDGRPEATTLLCVVYAQQQIQLSAFHRRVAGPVRLTDLMPLLERRFHLHSASGPTSVHGAIGLYADGQWSRLELHRRIAKAGVAGLDSTLVDRQILRPLLGIGPDSERLEFVPERQDLRLATAACDQDGGLLFTLAAPRLTDLFEVAQRGETMSAKTTYVEPKPRIGLFLQAAPP